MGTRKLDSLVELSPGFNTAVDVEGNLDNDAKVTAYIPTEVASEILLDVGENFHVSASRRARLITGTYGTGKSHLALILARIYRDSTKAKCLRPVLRKFGAKWPGKSEKLNSERLQLKGKFLCVLLNGDRWGSFDDSLLHYLDEALQKEGLVDLLPETAFDAALKRISELRESFKKEYSQLKKVIKDFGFESIKALEGQLSNKLRSAYDKFCEIHKAVSAGATFFHHYSMSPVDVYQDVAKRLVQEKGYAGIVIIWDEFGRYMERVVNDPGGMEGQSIQDFAQKGCNNSRKNQIHLYLICHRSLEEYVAVSATMRASGMSKKEQDEWKKISGRFREFHMKTTDYEVFQLIDQVIVQNERDPAWTSFVKNYRDYLDEWTDSAARLRIFPEFDRKDIHRIVTLGAYPLHPMAAFCLPRISERVAQNERTMFRFLSDSGADTLGPFLHKTRLSEKGRSPVFFPADKLWEFFHRDVAVHPIHRRKSSKLSQADVLVKPDDKLAKRIIRTVALLQVVGSDRAPCTEEVIAYCLGLSSSERSVLREKLKSLCTKEKDRDRVLVQSIKDGAYRFTGAASDDFDAKVEDAVQERLKMVSPAEHLRAIAGEIGIETEIPATEYYDDFMLNRALRQEIVDIADLQNAEEWLDNLGGGEFCDGYALVVLCENSQEILEAQGVAKKALKHSQIAVGIPEEPVHISTALRKHEAIRHLEKTQGHLYGTGADLREEWEQQDRDYLDAIGNLIKPLLNPEKRMLCWHFRGNKISNVGTRSRLRKAVSGMMREVFPLTPRIGPDRLTIEEGRDSFAGARRAIIDKLLMHDGATLLAKETSSQHKTVIEFVYRKNGILKPTESGFVVGQPDDSIYPAMSAVWSEIDAFIEKSKEAPVEMSDVVSTIRKPPYGLRVRSISLIISAAWRKYVQHGNISFDYRKSGSSTSRISRINGQVLDDAVISASKYRLVFTDISKKHEAMLFGVATAFGIDFTIDGDKGKLIDRIHHGVVQWWRGLTHFSRETRELDGRTIGLREQVLRPLAQEEADIHNILLNVAIDIVQPVDQKEDISPGAIADLFGDAKSKIEQSTKEILLPKMHVIVEEVFSGSSTSGKNPGKALRKWFKGLPRNRQTVRVAGDASVLSKVASSISRGEKSSQKEIDDLAREIIGVSLGDWDDHMLERFRGRLESAKRAIEEAEIVKVRPPEDESEVIVPPPKPGQLFIVISDDKGAFKRTFIPVGEISPSGENLKKIVQGAIEGIGRTLPSGECETIIVDIIRDMLQ